jgi:transposase
MSPPPDREEPSVSDLLAQIAALKAQLDASNQQLTTTAQQLSTATQQAKVLEQRNERLKLQVKRLAYLLYGRRSEKLNPEELGQLVLSFGGTEQAASEADPQVPAPKPLEEVLDTQGEASAAKAGKKKRNHPGRTTLSPLLERIVTPVLVADAERACKCCGVLMTAITPREHERIEHVPEKLVVHVEQREVLVCKNSQCRADATTAERQAPAMVRRVGASLLASLIENKCDDALPIHRQQDRLRRLGFDVPLNTLYEYWTQATDLLGPVAKTTLSCVLGEDYVNVDDTTLNVLDKTRSKGRYTGHLWCFVGTQPRVAFAFTQSWNADEIAPWIAAIDGHIQCDDYKGYSKLISIEGLTPQPLVPPDRRLGCMMHVRRRFHDAWKLGDKRATEPIAIIRELYLIEAEAKEYRLDAAARHALRTVKSLPWLAQLHRWISKHRPDLPPKSRLAEACDYALQQWSFIERCFSDGRFEIDNGKVERAIREPAIGRRNFLFTGSTDGAQRLADAYTLVQSCRAVGVSTRDYLIDVIDKIEHGWPARRIVELVPDRWARDRSLLTQAQQSA